MSWFYVAERDDGLVKIGFSIEPHQRIRLLELEHGELGVLACVPGSREDEAWLHRRWAHARVHGEWFRPDPDLIAAAMDGRLFKRRRGLCTFSRPAVAR